MTHSAAPARVLVLAVTATLLATLAGCSVTEPVPTAAPSTPAAAPTVEETAEPTRPALDELVISPEGIADLRVGHPVPLANPELLLVTWNPTGCIDPDDPFEEDVEGEPWAGRWESVHRGSDGAWPFWVVTDGTQNGVIQFIGSANVPTDRGIRVGSTRADVEAAYPGLSPFHGEFSLADLYIVDAGASRLVIEVVSDATWYPEMIDRVLVMYTESTSYPPSSIAGSDAGSTCIV
jgi:hypothetical protein